MGNAGLLLFYIISVFQRQRTYTYSGDYLLIPFIATNQRSYRKQQLLFHMLVTVGRTRITNVVHIPWFYFHLCHWNVSAAFVCPECVALSLVSCWSALFFPSCSLLVSFSWCLLLGCDVSSSSLPCALCVLCLPPRCPLDVHVSFSSFLFLWCFCLLDGISPLLCLLCVWSFSSLRLMRAVSFPLCPPDVLVSLSSFLFMWCFRVLLDGICPLLSLLYVCCFSSLCPMCTVSSLVCRVGAIFFSLSFPP